MLVSLHFINVVIDLLRLEIRHELWFVEFVLVRLPFFGCPHQLALVVLIPQRSRLRKSIFAVIINIIPKCKVVVTFGQLVQDCFLYIFIEPTGTACPQRFILLDFFKPTYPFVCDCDPAFIGSVVIILEYILKGVIVFSLCFLVHLHGWKTALTAWPSKSKQFWFLKQFIGGDMADRQDCRRNTNLNPTAFSFFLPANVGNNNILQQLLNFPQDIFVIHNRRVIVLIIGNFGFHLRGCYPSVVKMLRFYFAQVFDKI